MKFKIKKVKEKGVTLIEIVIAIFIITIFSLIVVNDFPRMKRQFAIAGVTYRLAQDIRRAEDLGMSGMQVSGASNTKGYGFYVNINFPENKNKYWIYADIGDTADRKFSGTLQDCSPETEGDCIIETINISDYETGVYIKRIEYFDNISDNFMPTNSLSINFNPPNPTVIITSGEEGTSKRIKIVLGLYLDDTVERIIYVNSAGLIEVE